MAVQEIEIDEELFLPKYRHLLESEKLFDIDFMYGGRDSGKSRHIAQQLLMSCLSAEYFRCVLIRKVKDTIKGSQWQLIKDVAEQWGISHLFSFTVSPLEIRCLNGNSFISRGCDEPGKIKSIANPSHCWIEEGNQLDEEDFTIIMSSLRSDYGKVKSWFSFNPECEGNYINFWLWKNWFSDRSEPSFEAIKTSLLPNGSKVEYTYRVTHSTYQDNPYCSDERKALYESYSKSSGYYYNVYTLGRWGFRVTGGEFWKQFKQDKHVARIERIEHLPIHVVLDNNYVPYITVALWQIVNKDKGYEFRQFGEIPCFPPNNSSVKAAKKVSAYLHDIKYKDKIFLYGDASANAKTTVDENNSSFFQKFIEVLQSDHWTVDKRVNDSNPRVAVSRDFIDEIYEHNLNGHSIIINEKCQVSIEDYTMAKEDPNGGVLKKNITDKDTKQSYQQYGHYSDAKRYFIIRTLENDFSNYRMFNAGKITLGKNYSKHKW